MFGASWWCHHNKAGEGGPSGHKVGPGATRMTSHSDKTGPEGEIVCMDSKDHSDHPLWWHELSGSPCALQDPPLKVTPLPIGQFHFRQRLLQSHLRKTESMFPHLKKAKWHSTHFLSRPAFYLSLLWENKTQPPRHPELIQPLSHTNKKNRKK